MGDAFQIAEIVDLSSRPFCCRDKGFSGDGQGLFLHFLWLRCAKRQKSRKSPRAPYAIHSHTNALLLIKHTLLIIGLRRSACQSALIISTHTRALGGWWWEKFFSIIDAEKLSRRRRRSARITKHAHCPCGYVFFSLSLSHIWVLCYMLTERGCECVSERSRGLLYNVTCARCAPLQQWKWDLEWRKFSGRRCSMQIAGFGFGLALSRSLARSLALGGFCVGINGADSISCISPSIYNGFLIGILGDLCKKIRLPRGLCGN